MRLAQWGATSTFLPNHQLFRLWRDLHRRNNWNFTGSDKAAERLATVATLCATCRHLGIDPWLYLRDVFRALAEGVSKPALVRDFMPWTWAQNEAKKAEAQKLAAVG